MKIWSLNRNVHFSNLWQWRRDCYSFLTPVLLLVTDFYITIKTTWRSMIPICSDSESLRTADVRIPQGSGGTRKVVPLGGPIVPFRDSLQRSIHKVHSPFSLGTLYTGHQRGVVSGWEGSPHLCLPRFITPVRIFVVWYLSLHYSEYKIYFTWLTSLLSSNFLF